MALSQNEQDELAERFFRYDIIDSHDCDDDLCLFISRAVMVCIDCYVI